MVFALGTIRWSAAQRRHVGACDIIRKIWFYLPAITFTRLSITFALGSHHPRQQSNESSNAANALSALAAGAERRWGCLRVPLRGDARDPVSCAAVCWWSNVCLFVMRKVLISHRLAAALPEGKARKSARSAIARKILGKWFDFF